MHLQVGRTELELVDLGLDLLVTPEKCHEAILVGLDLGLLELNELLRSEV